MRAPLAARGESPALGASPLNPLAPPLDHRGHDARLALRRLRTGRSAAMHSTASVLHRPGATKGAAGDADAVLAELDRVLDPGVATLALPRSISATMIDRKTLRLEPRSALPCYAEPRRTK